jgi:hypothetical protein
MIFSRYLNPLRMLLTRAFRVIDVGEVLRLQLIERRVGLCAAVRG